MKLEYFAAEWADKPEWVTAARREAFASWNKEYENSSATQAHPAFGSRRDAAVSNEYTEDVQWRRNKRARLASGPSDAFEAFQEEKGEARGIKGGLEYWVKTREQGDIHVEDLINMGLAIHSIPGMSAEPERVFSRYGIIYSVLFKHYE